MQEMKQKRCYKGFNLLQSMDEAKLDREIERIESIESKTENMKLMLNPSSVKCQSIRRSFGVLRRNFNKSIRITF